MDPLGRGYGRSKRAGTYLMKTIFRYQIDDRFFFADPILAYRKLYAAVPDLGKVCEKYNAALAALDTPDLKPYEVLEAEEEKEDAETLLVEGFRKAFGHPWVDSVPVGQEDTVFNVGHDVCMKTLKDFLEWTEEKKSSSGLNPTCTPSTAETP